MISVTGIDFEKRETVKKVVERNGGVYEKNLVQGRTTHLIAASTEGRKYKHAVDWGLPVVSETWISDCVERGVCLSARRYDVKELEKQEQERRRKQMEEKSRKMEEEDEKEDEKEDENELYGEEIELYVVSLFTFLLCHSKSQNVGTGGVGNRGMYGKRQRRGDRATKSKREGGEYDDEVEEEDEEIEIHHTRGEHGEHDYLQLELKIIADVGLVGFPNAGKSTLLQSLSRAKPKVANYPFTTLRPNLGAIQYKDGTQIFLADIPGIIDGAHENRGLGHDFLRHIERTNMIVYVLDGSGDYGRRDPCEDFRVLQDELRLYSSDMILRPSLVAINKMDLILESKDSGILNALGDFNDQFEVMRERIQEMSFESTGKRVPVVALSGMTGLRVSDLALAIRGISKPDSL